MEVLVLVCALSVAAADCREQTSVHSFHAAVQSGPIGCVREGMFHAAASGLVVAGTYPKVVCLRKVRIAHQR